MKPPLGGQAHYFPTSFPGHLIPKELRVYRRVGATRGVAAYSAYPEPGRSIDSLSHWRSWGKVHMNTKATLMSFSCPRLYPLELRKFVSRSIPFHHDFAAVSTNTMASLTKAWDAALRIGIITRLDA
jgi:hypothetical protein